jgi:uncharacterized iron-regulated protein
VAESVLPALIFLISLLPAAPPGIIVHGTDTVSTEAMLSELAAVQMVFVGEKHDDPAAHEWEFFLWQALASDERCLALEMFEVDVQSLLDRYLAADATLDELLEDGSPWSNYLEDYHSMVEFAAENGLRVIAANVPRHLAAAVARGGWDGLAGEPSADFFLSMRIDSSGSGYRERFMATMEMMGDQMHQMPMDPMDMYRAQLLKDAVMAWSVRGLTCLFICGSFHSDYRSGIPDQLEPEIDFLTVKIVSPDEEWGYDQADFLVLPPGEPGN